MTHLCQKCIYAIISLVRDVNTFSPVVVVVIPRTNEALEEGGPSIQYPFNYFEKYPISQK